MRWNWKSPARLSKWEGVEVMDAESCQNFQALYTERYILLSENTF